MVTRSNPLTRGLRYALGPALLIWFVLGLGVHRACAQTPLQLDWKPYTALAIGQALDGISTVWDFSRGCVEGNSRIYSRTPSDARVLGTKAVIVTMTAFGMRYLNRHGHPTAAIVLGYLNGGLGAGAGARNLMTVCR